MEAFLARPERARAAASALTLFVNGRAVRDRALARAVAQAYGSVLEAARYPLGVVYLELDPALVDVNVHPQKAEVRFADGRAVGEALFRVLADELARAFGMPVAVRTWNRPNNPDSTRDCLLPVCSTGESRDGLALELRLPIPPPKGAQHSRVPGEPRRCGGAALPAP